MASANSENEPSPLGRGIKELVREMQNRNTDPTWLRKQPTILDAQRYMTGRPLLMKDKGEEKMPDNSIPHDVPDGSKVPVHMLQDAQKEIERLKQMNLILDTKYIEANKSESSVREENRKLSERVLVLEQQLKKMSDRELESRTRAEVYEELAEKAFHKMIERMH